MTCINLTKLYKQELLKDRRLYKIYGITLDEWYKIYNKQKGVCAICKERYTKTGKLKALCVDHIHIKGFKKMLPEEKRKYIRGLCCFLCNVAIKFERSGKGRQILNGMVEYFEIHCMKNEI